MREMRSYEPRLVQTSVERLRYVK